ncbi:hypothetical protein ZIOFF_065619 [Zingiber officinale]|uniref:MADS-box domain-containing protein n=1 Tax=Zingiber officinale TaxID=94328 RepID=A0A8J5EXB8_ZINOF|nr:hypothetical protein ZIOFF_065619 [Zingiber officinale]
MWCEKIEIKRIENSTNQHVTFSKRRNGIIMEMTKISILYKEQVFVVIFSSSGKMSEFCSLSTILPKILERYWTNSNENIWDAKHEGFMETCIIMDMAIHNIVHILHLVP